MKEEKMELKQKIHEMKKIVLHIHLDGSLRPESVKEWLKQDGKNVSLEDVKNRLMINKDCKDLNEYLEKFELPSQVLQSKERIKQATYELYEDLAKQNVIYAEVRFAPSKHIENGLTYEEVVESAISGMQEAKKMFNIDGNLILCCMRGDNNKFENIQTVKVAREYLNKGVCAIDLAGAEALFATKNFEDIFKMARENNIPFTIHAGEADGAESVKKAIEFGAKRIGHGIRCIEDRALMQILRTEQIPLEVCPTSNVQTQAVMGEHPLQHLYVNKILTTINTDNNTVSNTDIEQEYMWVLQNTELQYLDLAQTNIYAARAIFDTPQKKAKLVQEIAEIKNEFERENGEPIR